MKIFVKAKPSAKKLKLEKVNDDHFVIAVKEPPEDGRANRAIVKALAEYFRIAPSRIRLVSGRTSRNKLYEIT